MLLTPSLTNYKCFAINKVLKVLNFMKQTSFVVALSVILHDGDLDEPDSNSFSFATLRAHYSIF